MWHRALILLVLGSLSLAPAALGTPPAPATTGGATSITTSSAVLNGAVNTTSSDSEWYFQYGTSSSSLTHSTAPQPIAAVSESVSRKISSLTAGTTYYYRLVVQQGVGYSPTTSVGSTLSFPTSPSNGAGGNTVATTGGATSITGTSAALNGVAHSSSADSGWAFQYGTSSNYGKLTPTTAIGTGVHAVLANVTGLKPGTTYHFRLVVNAGTYPRQSFFGVDRTFTTKSSSGKPPKRFGRARLRSHRLKVHHKIVSIPFKCTGSSGATCTGRVSISARGKVGTHVKTVSCGKARFSLKAGKSKTVHARVSGGCAALLKRAVKHRIHAKLQARFNTPQSRLKTRVTLVRV